MDSLKEVTKRIQNNGNTFQLEPGDGGGSQVHMVCSRSLVIWSLLRGVLILLVRFFSVGLQLNVHHRINVT